MLKREQKEAIGLLQIGTFLEYFDLMLYVHMAILLNEVFFPKVDPHSEALLAAFAFCSTYFFRPFGALFIGYLGDRMGRKSTVIITTMMMAFSCIMMANLPTYAQVGITATWIVTLCRIIQGISSMSEIVGAQIYVSEIVKPPHQYVAVSSISVASSVGSVSALGIATLVTNTTFDWRLAFWMGAAIAVVGSVARTRLRETPEFLMAQHQKKLKYESLSSENQTVKAYSKTSLAYFLIYSGWPMSFYVSFMYFNPLLKEQFGYSSNDIIFHNFLLSLISLAITAFLAGLSYKVNPLNILKIRGLFHGWVTLWLPFAIKYSTELYEIFLIQTALHLVALSAIPGDSILLRHFPVLKRFTISSFLYALKSTVMYVITSFGVVYLTRFAGHWGLWILMLPVTFGFLWGVRHFEILEATSDEDKGYSPVTTS